MWYAYRIQKLFWNRFFTVPLSAMPMHLTQQRKDVNISLVSDTEQSLARDFEAVSVLFKGLRWNGTHQGVYCFGLPAAPSMLVGFMLTQMNDDTSFVGSPVALTYLDDVVDFDARIDTETIRAAQAALTGVPKGSLPSVPRGQWKTSAKGNLWRDILGTVCVVIPNNFGSGYCGMLRKGTEMPIYTRALPTPSDVMNYIEAEYWELVRGWGTSDGPVINTNDDNDLLKGWSFD
jgi:hypothetical protein